MLPAHASPEPGRVARWKACLTLLRRVRQVLRHLTRGGQVSTNLRRDHRCQADLLDPPPVEAPVCGKEPIDMPAEDRDVGEEPLGAALPATEGQPSIGLV